jgi:hypothetical protein
MIEVPFSVALVMGPPRNKSTYLPLLVQCKQSQRKYNVKILRVFMAYIITLKATSIQSIRSNIVVYILIGFYPAA